MSKFAKSDDREPAISFIFPVSATVLLEIATVITYCRGTFHHQPFLFTSTHTPPTLPHDFNYPPFTPYPPPSSPLWFQCAEEIEELLQIPVFLFLLLLSYKLLLSSLHRIHVDLLVTSLSLLCLSGVMDVLLLTWVLFSQCGFSLFLFKVVSTQNHSLPQTKLLNLPCSPAS